MAKFRLEPGGEVSGVFPNGEAWRVTFDSNGAVSVKDADISATLAALAALPDHPIKAVKG